MNTAMLLGDGWVTGDRLGDALLIVLYVTSRVAMYGLWTVSAGLVIAIVREIREGVGFIRDVRRRVRE